MQAARCTSKLVGAGSIGRSPTRGAARAGPGRAGLSWAGSPPGGGGRAAKPPRSSAPSRPPDQPADASLAAATGRGDVAALIDTYDTFDVGSALAAGVSLDRLLWARGDPAGAPRPHVLLERAVKAFGLVLEAGGFGVVALDLADAAPADLARLPFTTWRRLQRFVEGRDTVALVLTPAPVPQRAASRWS